MKYSREKLINLKNTNKFLFFWGHQPSRDGSTNQSCLSQWWQVDFLIDGITYKSAEHFMMAEKARIFNDHKVLGKILVCKTPAEAKKLGRQVRNFIPSIWEQHRFDIVKKANWHKFSQNDRLKTFLLTTKKRILVEASPVDQIWGIGLAKDHEDAQNPESWKGLNLLGFALMEVRDRLINEYPNVSILIRI